MTSEEYPTFQLGKSRFDQTNFQGRLFHIFEVIDPRTLFTSEKKLLDSISLLDKFKAGSLPPGITNQHLWEAQKIKQAIIHPDTGEKIIMPFRMSGFVPFGSPIVVGLMLPGLSYPQMIFWQWLNQSHNAFVNYSNRNASKETPMSRFLTGYTGAVTVSVSVAVGLSALVQRAQNLRPAIKMMVQKFVPFPAVAFGSVCNVLLMRNYELSEGIDVFDSEGNVVGTSLVAAKKALKETAITRMVLPVPILVIPPIFMTLMEKTRLLKRIPRLHLAFNFLITTASFAFGLPIAIALFPQFSKINRDELEPELQAKTSQSELIYNKGL